MFSKWLIEKNGTIDTGMDDLLATLGNGVRLSH